MPAAFHPSLSAPDRHPAGRAAPHALARTFGAGLLALRLPEGDAIALDESGAALLHAARAGCTPEELATELARAGRLAAAEAIDRVERILEPLGDRLARMSSTGLQGDGLSPTFASPRWKPPASWPGRPLPSLPDESEWRLLVAATARPRIARRALHEWKHAPGSRHSGSWRRLAPLIAANLARSPDEIPTDGADATRQTWVGNASGLQRLAPLLSTLAAAGIRVAIIKGLAAAILDYRDLALRPMNDFDIVVPFADRPRAIALLEAAGFAAHAPCPEAFARRFHSGAYVRPGQLNLDLHWHALWCNCWPGADEPFWADVRPAEIAGAPCHLPSPEFRFLMACAHGLRHAGQPAHYWIADAAMVLTTHGDALDWPRLIAEARRRRLVRLLREACHYLHETMGAPIPVEVLARLDRVRPALLENRIFVSFQQREPGRHEATRALVSWLNQYRIGARGFRPGELYAFLHYLRVCRGGGGLPRFLLHVSAQALRKLRPRWLRPHRFPDAPPPSPR